MGVRISEARELFGERFLISPDAPTEVPFTGEELENWSKSGFRLAWVPRMTIREMCERKEELDVPLRLDVKYHNFSDVRATGDAGWWRVRMVKGGVDYAPRESDEKLLPFRVVAYLASTFHARMKRHFKTYIRGQSIAGQSVAGFVEVKEEGVQVTFASPGVYRNHARFYGVFRPPC